MSYREERRADQAAAAEQAREDRRLMLEAQLKAKEIDAEQKRRDSELKAEQARKDADARRRQELADQKVRDAKKAAQKAAKAAKRAKLRRWLKTNPATLFVGFVMVASIVPAVISQVAALAHGGVFVLLAVLLAAMLEGGAWAITFMGKQAEDAGRPTGKYRTGTWSTAVAAAVIQFWHWSQAAPLWVACVFAGSSLFAIYIWDLKTHGSHGKTRAQRREEKARRKHAKARREHHKEIAKQADRLKSAMPYGALDDETAFAAAWRIATGAEPAMSAELYAQATNATVQLGAAFELGEHVRPELLETGLKAAQFNPFREIAQTTTTQAGIGLYGSETPSEKDPHTTPSGGSAETPSGRSEEELEALLPDALAAAAELVAEGAQISAAGLAKKLQIRREDAMKLRDRVIAERKLHIA